MLPRPPTSRLHTERAHPPFTGLSLLEPRFGGRKYSKVGESPRREKREQSVALSRPRHSPWLHPHSVRKWWGIQAEVPPRPDACSCEPVHTQVWPTAQLLAAS